MSLLAVVTTGEGEMLLIFLMVNFELVQGHLYYVVISSLFPLSMSDCVPYILCLPNIYFTGTSLVNYILDLYAGHPHLFPCLMLSTMPHDLLQSVCWKFKPRRDTV